MHLSRMAAAYAHSRWARCFAVVVFAVLVWGVLTKFLFVAWPYRIDLDVYRIGGQVWLNGGDLYGVLPSTELGVQLPFTYPPLAAVLFAPLNLVPLPGASTVFTASSVAALFVVVWLVVKSLTRWGWGTAAWVAVPLAAAMTVAEPVLATFNFGQINIILMLLVVVDAVLGRGRWWQGALIGLAIAIKLTPAVFLAYFLVRRDWRALAMGVGSAVAYTGLGFLLAPSDSLQYWTQTLRDPSRIGILSYVSNQSLNGVLVRFGVGDGMRPVLWVAVCAVLGLGLLYLMYRLVGRGEDTAAWSLMGLYALLASPVSWSHHWVWAFPAVLVALAWGRRSPAALTVGIAGAVVFFSYVIWAFPAQDHVELTWGPLGKTFGNSYVWWGIAFVVLAAFQALRPGRVLEGPADEDGR